MKAFAVFDGGGVKGAAFAGCLRAAETHKISFVGYAGTSAGSIVALLACIGYSGTELRDVMTDEVDFSQFLDDGGEALDSLLNTPIPEGLPRVSNIWQWYKLYSSHKSLVNRVIADLGLYDGENLKRFLHKKVKQKIPQLENHPDFTFRDLEQTTPGIAPLKIVASDVCKRVPVEYSFESNPDIPVLSAVRASISYPFVFKPVPHFSNFLLDGGLSINLPIHVFETTSDRSRVPIIAFDLVDKPVLRKKPYDFKDLFGDMMATALESSEHLLHKTIRNVYHVPIFLDPSKFRTLDFRIDAGRRSQLYDLGYIATDEFFKNQVPYWAQASDQVERLQAQYVPKQWVEPILESVARDFEEKTSVEDVRASIMLPIDASRKLVVYQFNMTGDHDEDLELSIEGGCTGKAWTERAPTFADLREAANNPLAWGMSVKEQRRVKEDRSAMVSFPVFDVSATMNRVTRVSDLPVIGVFSIDTKTPLNDTRWLKDHRDWVIQTGKRWADIIARVLT